ncbi:hypothetical protein Y695_03605 [Hydrogenophaga sp. T4]|nr:hypothetical protein Y695_03605 [Hydrogenophaga sp. T4]
MVDGIAHAGLGGQVQHRVITVFGKQPCHGIAVGQVQAVEHEARPVQQLLQAGLLERGLVVGVQVVQALDLKTLVEQAPAQVKTDEAGGAGDQDFPAGPGDRFGHGNTPFVTGW